MIAERNIYHPFLNKSVGFFISTKSGTYSGEILTDLNLYWQPVVDPKIATAFSVVVVLVMFAGAFVHYHLWKMLKREQNLVSSVLKTYVVVQMIFWPFMTTFECTTYFIYPLSEITGSWFCVFSFFIVYPSIIFISFHTTIMCIMRYAFIVHDENVASFGKQRTIKLFHWILGIVTIVMTIWLYFGAVDQSIDGNTTINRCSGSYDKIFHLKMSYGERQSVWNARCGMKINEGPSTSIELIRSIQCAGSAILLVLLLSNVFDAFIYYRTWTHIMRRYVKLDSFQNNVCCFIIIPCHNFLSLI